MASNNSYTKNIYNGANPFVWTGGVKDKVGQTLDPFNISGWNSEDAAPYSGVQPGQPGYTAGYDPNSMSFADELDARLNGINPDMRGMNAFREEALRKGSSAWGGMMRDKQFAEEGAARDRARTEGRSGRAQAEADLASRGGLSAGAKERIARKGGTDILAMGQDVSRQGNLNRMQIGIQDEQNRIGNLAQLPGMENQIYQGALQKEGMWDQAKQLDTNRLIAENQNRNQYNQNLYNQQMQAWAADRQAYATENAGKK